MGRVYGVLTVIRRSQGAELTSAKKSWQTGWASWWAVQLCHLCLRAKKKNNHTLIIIHRSKNCKRNVTHSVSYPYFSGTNPLHSCMLRSAGIKALVWSKKKKKKKLCTRLNIQWISQCMNSSDYTLHVLVYTDTNISAIIGRWADGGRFENFNI